MLNLVIAESELELNPEEILDHPLVKAYAKARGKLPKDCLFDSGEFNEAALGLGDGALRGKPEIVYLSLLTALESEMNKSGKLRIFVHTRNNYVISVSSKTRIPRHYPRFLDLMEQLFSLGRIPPEGEPMMVIEKKALKELIKGLGSSKVIFVSFSGKSTKKESFLDFAKKGESVVVFGGFSDRDFSDANKKLADKIVNLSEYQLPTWSLVGMLVLS